MHRASRILPAIACAIVLLFTAAAAAPGPKRLSEYQVKAAFLYNFTKFIEWPPGHFAARDSPIVFGVMGGDGLRGELEKIVRRRELDGHTYVVTRIDKHPESAAIDVLFIATGEENSLDSKALTALQAAGVLTVGESGAAADLGLIISFTAEKDRVRFEINLAEANRAHLKLSSQLLKLATAVRRER